MKISLAQIRPINGDIGSNIRQHLQFIDEAIRQKADLILFPELSLTAYEPTLAEALAMRPSDPRLDIFQEKSNEYGIHIGLGVPTVKGSHLFISLILFRPNQSHLIYSKKHLHADEEPFFESGENFPVFQVGKEQLAPAICYEISVPEHAITAFEHGADIYIASVVKFAKDMRRAYDRLTEIANNFNAPVLMVNAIGTADNGTCGGQSAVWNAQGELVDQLPSDAEGILFFNTDTGHSSSVLLPLTVSID